MLVVLALLGCTAAAFAVTEGLKLEKSPITDTQVAKVVAPDSVAGFATAPISFLLRKQDRLTVQIVNGNGDVIRTLARSRPARRGTQQFIWNGRDDRGHVVPDGTYKPRVHLARERRTIALPNSIRMDATPPLIKLVSVRPLVFSPDGDFRLETVRIHYLTNEKAQAILYVDGDRKTTVNRLVRAGKLDWGGRGCARSSAGAPPASVAGDRRGRKPLESNPRRGRAGALHRGRAACAAGAHGSALRLPGRHRRQALQLASRLARGCQEAAAA